MRARRGNEAPPLEAWAGFECTVNRVGDQHLDQLVMTGHHDRASDLDLVAWLGVKALRYPVLWERTAPGELADADWSWPDARLARLRELRIRPIVGLVHHGSGPLHTSLVDPAFPEKLATYARAVAERYPWVKDWTPVNEPCTTARFSGLYGHWYPHGRSLMVFVRTLLQQCHGIRRAMKAIRSVIPDARLIQTEDAGRTHSTPELAYQATYDNQRRWLALDLLAGHVTPEHPMWHELIRAGATQAELEQLAGDPCLPDLVGLNYYLTSDRFLDQRLHLYPAHTHGGNNREAYADVETVRVADLEITGHEALLREAAARYGRPVGFTEVHLGCTREEQVRWLAEAWHAAERARAGGVDVRAVTAWSLLGAYDWDKLVVRAEGHYEPGVFDLRSETPRPTALAEALRTLAHGRALTGPTLTTPGWWRRPDRIFFPRRRVRRACTGDRPLVIAGGGTLGQALAEQAEIRGLPYLVMSRQEMDIADARTVHRQLDQLRPWALINAAGYVRVDDAETDRERCWRENVVGPAVLAEACKQRGLRLVTFSSDLVFDGRSDRPYHESQTPEPLGVYGASKAEAERLVLSLLPSALVVRTAAFFGPDPYNFVHHALTTLETGSAFRAAHDQVVSPTYVPHLASAVLDLLIDGERGLWHLANGGALSWADLARTVATMSGLDSGLVQGCDSAALGLVARRPPFSALGSERGRILPALTQALAIFLRERQARRQPTEGARACV